MKNSEAIKLNNAAKPAVADLMKTLGTDSTGLTEDQAGYALKNMGRIRFKRQNNDLKF